MRGHLRYWQKVLRLQDWDLEVDIVRDRDMPECCNGHLAINVQWKLATISILAGVDRVRRDIGVEEVDLVHELLHVVFHNLHPDNGGVSLTHDLFEQGLNLVAEALVGLRHGK